MWILILVAAAIALTHAQGACPEKQNEMRYYDGIGCTAVGLDNNGCPTSYDCSVLEQRSKDKCYIKDKAYDVGHTLESSADIACLEDCGCQMDKEIRDSAQFECINVECPDEVGSRVGPNCYRTYDHSHCCHTNEICVPLDVKSTGQTCLVNDRVYREGEEFYPGEGHCLKCICQPGFNGSFVAPWCRTVNCHLDLVDGAYITDGAAPIFYGTKGCCPIEWRSPNSTTDDIYADDLSIPASDSGKTCKFGGLTLNVGQRLNDNAHHPDVECKCTVPPHVVCLKKASKPTFKRYY